MRVNLLVSLAALLCLAVASTAATASTSQIGARYQWQGESGALTIVAPLGTPYSATDANGVTVVAGAVKSPMTHAQVPNVGADALGVVMTVRVGDILFSISDPEWQWD